MTDTGQLDGIPAVTPNIIRIRTTGVVARINALGGWNAQRTYPRWNRPKPKVLTRIVVSDRGERWECFEVAAMSLGVCESAVREAIRNNTRCQGRFVWYEGERPAVLGTERERGVVRIEDGQAFPSRRAAMESLGIDPHERREQMRLFRAVRDGDTYCGYHWRNA